MLQAPRLCPRLEIAAALAMCPRGKTEVWTFPLRLHHGCSAQLTAVGYSVRESVPSKLPEKPPYTAHLGNLSYDATSESVTAFFEGCDVVSVRIIEDRELQRPKGFGYVEFGNLDGLKKALTLDGESFEGRMIKIKVADPRMCPLPWQPQNSIY